jgi:hypothetical protein
LLRRYVVILDDGGIDDGPGNEGDDNAVLFLDAQFHPFLNLSEEQEVSMGSAR